MRKVLLLVLTLIALVAWDSPSWSQASSPKATQPLPRAYVMDADKRSVNAVSFESGSITSTIRFDRMLSAMLLSPDNTRLLVFDADYPKLQTDRHTAYKRVTSPTALTILDTSDMKTVARIEDVGWNAAPILLSAKDVGSVDEEWDSAGDKVILLAEGVRDHPPELVQIDIRGARVSARLPLHVEADGVFSWLQPLVPGKRAAVLCQAKNEQESNRTAPVFRVVIADLRDLSASKELSFAGNPGSVYVSPDGAWLYVVALGSTKAKAAAAVPAQLHAVSLTDLSVAAIPATGAWIGAGVPDEGRGVSAFPYAGRNGEPSRVIVMRGSRPVAEVTLSDTPLGARLSPNKTLLYVMCVDSVQVIDLDSTKVAGAILTPHHKTDAAIRIPFLDTDHGGLLAFDREEMRAYLLPEGEDKLLALDLEARKVAGVVDLESGWAVFGRELLGAAFGSRPRLMRGWFGGSEMLMGPADAHLYVVGGKQIEVVDLATLKQVNKSKLGFTPFWGRFVSASQGPIIEVSGLTKPRTDVGRREWRVAYLKGPNMEEAVEQEWLGPGAQTADRRYVISFDSENAYCLDLNTLAVVKKIPGFEGLRQALVSEPLVQTAK